MMEKKDELVQWLKFIANPENKEVERFMEENKFLKQAREELAYLSGDPDFQRLLEARAGFLWDMHLLKMEAQEEKQQEKIRIAKELLKNNMPIEQIAKITELTEDEIRKLNEKD